MKGLKYAGMEIFSAVQDPRPTCYLGPDDQSKQNHSRSCMICHIPSDVLAATERT